MKIAVLAWGSLVWQRANEHGELALLGEAEWRQDGPWLPVEFARISSDGRLTLILVPGSVAPSRVLWAPSRFHDMDQAIENLAQRETRAPLDAIHAVAVGGRIHGEPDRSVSHVVEGWLLGRPEIDAVIWTGLSPGPRWVSAGYPGFSTENAVAYIAGLDGRLRRKAIEYVRRAPAQIDTPVRRALHAVMDEGAF